MRRKATQCCFATIVLILARSAANQMRDNVGPVVLAQVKHNVNVDKIANYILEAWKKGTVSTS